MQFATIEVTAWDEKKEIISASVPRCDDLDSFYDGLTEFVLPGINHDFPDSCVAQYFGIEEQVATQTDPTFQKLISKVDNMLGPKPPSPSVRPSIIPSTTMLASVQRSQPPTGGYFHRLTHLIEARYVIAPSRRPTVMLCGIPTMLLSAAICTTGTTIVDAMIQDGVKPFTIDYRDELPFEAFRCKQIGDFFARQLFEA